jgi:hypothetical protein
VAVAAGSDPQHDGGEYQQQRQTSCRHSGVEDTGGNSNGRGTDNNQQGCGSGVGSGRMLPLSSFPSSSSLLSSLQFLLLLQFLF